MVSKSWITLPGIISGRHTEFVPVRNVCAQHWQTNALFHFSFLTSSRASPSHSHSGATVKCATIMCRNDELSSMMSWVDCFQTDSGGGRHFVDIIGDISWTKGVTSCGHFWRHLVDKNVHEMSSFWVTFRGHFFGDISWTLFRWILVDFYQAIN